jgi:methionine-rich copper-binding protein CopC
MTFNEAIRAGSGNILIYNSNGTIARTISVTDTSQVAFSGNTVTINPTADLAGGASYYVNLASGVIKDTAGNNFAGISGTAAWNFTTATVDITAPLLSSATPADNSTNVAVGSNLVMTFNEAIRAGSGNILIYNGNGTIARTISVTDTSQVTFSGNTVTINPTADLAGGAGYYVNLASGVIKDTAGNNFAGISDNTAWNFTTGGLDYAGNTLSAARDLGILSGASTFTDFVGTSDTNDYYRFTLNARSTLALSLTGMTADADVQLFNSQGSTIATSTAGGASNEAITQTLEAGTYYVRVYQYSGDTNYNLYLNQTNAPLVSGVTRYGSDTNDTILGTNYADLLSGVPITGSQMGRGTIDVMTGGLGSDLFILGDSRGRFYDDQILSNSGRGDYAVITDFQVDVDRAQLSSGYYFLATTAVNGRNGEGFISTLTRIVVLGLQTNWLVSSKALLPLRYRPGILLGSNHEISCQITSSRYLGIVFWHFLIIYFLSFLGPLKGYFEWLEWGSPMRTT